MDLIKYCLALGANASTLTAALESPLHWLLSSMPSASLPRRSSSSDFVPLADKDVDTVTLEAAVLLVKAGCSLFAVCASRDRPYDVLPLRARCVLLSHSTLRDRCLVVLAERQLVQQKIDKLPRELQVCLKVQVPDRPRWWRGKARQTTRAELL